MKNLLEYICFVFLSKLIMLWGINNSRKFSSVLAIFFFYIVPIRKFTTIENLKIAFPGLSDDKIKKIAYKSYKSFCTTLIEILHMPAMTHDEIKKQVNCKNSELIKNKYDEQKGVILLSAHFL
jgi:KDO2-lipid IV(A) lauroyltransferase